MSPTLALPPPDTQAARKEAAARKAAEPHAAATEQQLHARIAALERAREADVVVAVLRCRADATVEARRTAVSRRNALLRELAAAEGAVLAAEKHERSVRAELVKATGSSLAGGAAELEVAKLEGSAEGAKPQNESSKAARTGNAAPPAWQARRELAREDKALRCAHTSSRVGGLHG